MNILKYPANMYIWLFTCTVLVTFCGCALVVNTKDPTIFLLNNKHSTSPPIDIELYNIVPYNDLNSIITTKSTDREVITNDKIVDTHSNNPQLMNVNENIGNNDQEVSTDEINQSTVIDLELQHKEKSKIRHQHHHHHHHQHQHHHNGLETSSSSQANGLDADTVEYEESNSKLTLADFIEYSPSTEETVEDLDASDALASVHPLFAYNVENSLYDVKNINLDENMENALKKQLLSMLEIEEPPVIDRSKIVIPKFLMDLYNNKRHLDVNYVARSFTHIESMDDNRYPHHNSFRLYFDVKIISQMEEMELALLQLSRDVIREAILHPHILHHIRYQVLVYDIIEKGLQGKQPDHCKLIENRTISLNNTEVLMLDVKEAVERWIQSPENNYGLLVEVKTSTHIPAPLHHVRLRRSAEESEKQWLKKQPFLLTYSKDNRARQRTIHKPSLRAKRSTHTKKAYRRRNSADQCRRHPYFVDFTDVGWADWIVAPLGYDAYYCQGKCSLPLADHLNATNHAVMQTIMNNLNPNLVPSACCVPTQLDVHTFLYLNDNSTVILKYYNDMSVSGCGCR